MNCPFCGSSNTEKIGFDIFNDLFECGDCEEEFETPRDKTTDNWDKAPAEHFERVY